MWRWTECPATDSASPSLEGETIRISPTATLPSPFRTWSKEDRPRESYCKSIKQQQFYSDEDWGPERKVFHLFHFCLSCGFLFVHRKWTTNESGGTHTTKKKKRNQKNKNKNKDRLRFNWKKNLLVAKRTENLERFPKFLLSFFFSFLQLFLMTEFFFSFLLLEWTLGRKKREFPASGIVIYHNHVNVLNR